MATRQELRRRVGRNLGGLSSFSPTILTSTTLSAHNQVGVENDVVYYRDNAYVVTQASNVGMVWTLTIDPAFPAFTAGDEVELWAGNRWHPEEVNGFINDAISDAVGRVYDPVDELFECVTPRSRRFQLADDVDMVNDVYKRSAFRYRNIYTYETPKIPTASENDMESEQDYDDFQYSPSWRIDISGATGSYQLNLEFSQTNLSGATHFEGWFKGIGVSALTVTLKNGTDAIGGARTLTLPSMGEWHYLQVAIDNPHLLREIDNLTFDITTSASPAVLWTNTLYGVDQDSIDWRNMDRAMWRVERESRNLVILPTSTAFGAASGSRFASHYREEGALRQPIEDVVRIQGGKDPVPLTDDDDETSVDSWFVVCAATELGFGPSSGGSQVDPDRAREQVRLWAVRREQAMRTGFQPLVNVRVVKG